MNAIKTFVWIGLFLGSTLGAYMPVLWHGSLLSISSLLFSTIGGIGGIIAGYKIGQNYF